MCTFILAPHVSDETSISLHPMASFRNKNKTQNGLLAHGVYSSERLGTYECCMHELTFFTLTSACLADEGAKVRRNRRTERSGSDVRWIAVARRIVSAKYKAYFHFRSIKSYSVIPLFRYSVIPYSAFYRLPGSRGCEVSGN